MPEPMQLAQLNIARMRAPLGSELMREFEENLDPINRLAEQSPGFVWRYQEDNNNATSVRIFDDDYWLINMSVWKTVEDLFNFAYKSHHLEFFRRRREWFEATKEMTTVLWYVPPRRFPTIKEALDRLLHLRENGETPYAFSFRRRFTAEDLEAWSR